MLQVIIYLQDNGVVAIVRPTQEALDLFGIELIAKKDVPSGLPYKIVDSSDVPTDRSDRNLWTIDEEDLTDGIGSEHTTFEGVISELNYGDNANV